MMQHIDKLSTLNYANTYANDIIMAINSNNKNNTQETVLNLGRCKDDSEAYILKVKHYHIS